MSRDILGDIEIANPPTSELPVRDSLDRARFVFRKGRHESMGGTTVYTQGHGVEGYENQVRLPGYCPSNVAADPISKDLYVDHQE